MELVLSFDLVLQGSTCPPLHTYTCGRICTPHQKILASSIIRYEWNFLTLILLDFLEILRLNLINHFVGFIPYQFACNSALRNPVFIWESCKGSVWAQDCALSKELTTGSHGLLAACKSPNDAHEWSMKRSWTVTPAGAL